MDKPLGVKMSKKGKQALNNTQIGIIRLCKSAIKGSIENLPPSFSWEEAKKIIENHNIFNLIHFGCVNSKIDEPNWNKQRFLTNCMHLSVLWNDADKIIKSFNDNEIEYIALKGLVIKDMYPNPLMRNMSDVDILIKKKKYQKKIKPLMLSLGFVEKTETDHDYEWAKGTSTFELHKRLIPSYDEDYFKLIGNDWDWYNNNNEYTYDFIHFAKHFRDAGIGLVHLVDVEVYRDFIELDKIEKFDLVEFCNNIFSVLDVCFHDKAPNTKDLCMLNFIFDSGVYGSRLMAKKTDNLKHLNYSGNSKNAKKRILIKKIFPSFKDMSFRYPCLKNCPILLPFIWTGRTFRLIFSKKTTITINELEVYDNKDIDLEDTLNYFGLSYNKIK